MYLKKLLFIQIILLILINCRGNKSPNTPASPSGSTSGITNESLSFSAHTTDPDDDDIAYRFVWGDGNLSSWSSYVSSGDSVTQNHSYISGGTYTVRVKAKDIKNKESEWSSGLQVEIIETDIPNTPQAPSGPSSGFVDSTYNFSTSTTDPDGDSVAYQFDWGDGTYSEWSNYVPSGDSVSMDHSYSSEGTYSVKSKARDENGAESSWSSGHSITITEISPGDIVWFFSTGNSVRSSPAIGTDGTIYVGCEDQSLYAINPDGTQKWRFLTGDYVQSSPAIGANGTIYVGSLDDNLYAINPDGTEKWAFSTGDYVQSSPAIGADGTIYVGSRDGNLYAINPDGTEKWKFPTGGDVGNSSPAIDSDGTIYVGAWDDNLYAINPDGTEKWKFPTGGDVDLSPAIGADGTIYVASWNDNLYAINPDGTEKWVFTSGDTVASSPAIGADGTIYVGYCNGNLYAINPDCSEKWTFSTEGSVYYSSPAIGLDGTIYVGSSWDNLYAINPDGSEKWSCSIESWIWSSPAIGADGTIYVGSFDNNLYAIYGSSGGLANTPWPMFRHDLKHTGRATE